MGGEDPSDYLTGVLGYPPPEKGTPWSFVVIWESWFATEDPSPGYTITGIPTSAQLYIHWALSAGRWMQPWLCAEDRSAPTRRG